MDDASLVENIKSHFENVLPSFPLKTQRHYAERLYRITGDKKYADIIANYYKQMKQHIQEDISLLDNPDRQEEFGNRFFNENIHKTLNSRILERVSYYNKNPRTKYFLELVTKLDKLQDHSLFDGFGISKPEILKKLKKTDFRKLLIDDELLLVDPVQTTNAIYHLKNLDIVNLENEYLERIKVLYEKTTNTDMYYNKLYALTHAIISDSRYYQRFVTSTSFSWIYDFFDKDIDNILESTTSDIMAEVALCDKLKRRTNHKNLDLIKSKLRTLVNRDGLILERKEAIDTKEFVHAEHRNVLMILLFSEYSKLYVGPKLVIK